MEEERLFGGAERVGRYSDPNEVPVLEGLLHVERTAPGVEPHQETPEAGGSYLAPEPALPAPVEDDGLTGTVLPPLARPEVPLATTGWRGSVRRATFGLVKPTASPRELAHHEDLRTIRQATWVRAVNVLVANQRGGVGCTMSAVVLGGLLATYRGGYVAVTEATQDRGYLSELSEGAPTRGLAELLLAAPSVDSAGAVGGYTAPQTSHADIIGSVAARSQLTGGDVQRVRRVLDRFYRITVTDAGSNNLHAGAWLAATDTADALVVPVQPRPLAVHGAARVMSSLRARDDEHSRHLLRHSTAIVTHDGGTEDKDLTAQLPELLDSMGFASVVEVPYDPALRAETELNVESLSGDSIHAWTHAAAEVVKNLLDAPTASPVVASS